MFDDVGSLLERDAGGGGVYWRGAGLSNSGSTVSHTPTARGLDSRCRPELQEHPVTMVSCTMYSYSTTPHVSQLYTGFSLLSKQQDINLKQKLTNYPFHGKEVMKHIKPDDFYGLFVALNDRVILYYDVSDGPKLNEEALELADIYFKRSYLDAEIPSGQRSRVFPLGFNYEVYSKGFNHHECTRVLLRGNGKTIPYSRQIATYLARLSGLSFDPILHRMHCPPKFDQEPRVIFMARAWDPDDVPPGLPAKTKEDLGRINDMRADCIQLLRKELGKQFYGGFSHNSYATRHYKGLLIEDASMSRKKNYVSLLHQHPICIATTGLQGSIGWKMAEYVAFSKSIVSEKLRYVVPGDFKSGRNYLEFDTPDSCLQQTVRLIEDRSLRQQMMEGNWHYYQTYMVPDKLVLRTINIAKHRLTR